ncbi:acyl-CoA dehydrogenase [Oleomonas cavernae]|uniref:3-methylmercaptopropionyl-CoA dehydrogenase n=1 Tax=Oleomonas cavernae TaxID=2320859 RepID=A0A418W8G2_9PROT|nr:acyl-CoA dehydrogenase C-terminal domain-containing protein [Oleomonas cavernae]RJF86278.1 acyl-CoA dehydrogenase [Oleomonas cavernae]
MPSYKAPVDDIRFVLNDVLNIGKYSNLAGFADAPRDVVDAILDEGAKICERVLAPLNQVGDAEGCKIADGVVTTPTGFKQAYKTFVDGGWPGITGDPEFGGQGMPYVLGFALNEFVSSSNMAFGMYPGLSHGAYAAIHQWGTDDQKQTYLPKLVSGEWTGTMNLTEPHCGTDLGLLRTRAEPQGDGTYKITGTKIFISAGEHDMSDNIIHLVLAKIPGGPEGVKGISLFIVPKFMVEADGSLGARNGVKAGNIEHKMGIIGNSTCVMNFDEATGFLIGEEHKGLRAMFTMMNAARLGVGIQGLSQAEVAYQNAAIYAKDRLQMRSISGTKFPEKPADPIIVHPDVRRMLLSIRSFVEGARAFYLWTGLKIDLSHKDPDPAVREANDDIVALVTPVVKGYLTDKGFESTVAAQQVFGGHGYIKEWGMEQFVRDARISQIYEGTNGIQALDLVGRKLGQNGGRGLFAYIGEVEHFVAENAGNAELKPFLDGLQKATGDLRDGAMWFMQNAMANPDNAGAGSVEYMHLFGIQVLAYMWSQMAKISLDAKAAGTATEFHENKLIVGRFFLDRIVPDTASLLVKLSAGADSIMALKAANF